MRVVSLVPSWTETLLVSGVNVVARTRFCVHPKDLVSAVPAVGGTKDWNWNKVLEVQPDLLLLDREENPKFMAEQSTIPWHASHISSLKDMPGEIERLSKALGSLKLNDLADRWRAVCAQSAQQPRTDLNDLPGVLEWGRRPVAPIKKVLYMIWKDPWMCVSRDTFIGSMLSTIGVEVPSFPYKYPKVDLSLLDPEQTLLLLSSEPYPFFKRKKDFKNLEFPHAYVQGEYFSWFGVRALEFLEGLT